MRRISQEDFIAALMQGEFYQGYIEGVGIACSNLTSVLSPSPPLPFNPLDIQQNRYWYHSIQRLVIRPLQVIAPTAATFSSHTVKELYEKTSRPNFSNELTTWVDRLEREARSAIAFREREIAEREQLISTLDAVDDARKIQRKRSQIARLEQENAEYAQVLREIESLALSDQQYDLQIDSRNSTQNVDMGMLTVDVASRTIIVSLPPNPSLGHFAHELKHAYQFETGQLSLREFPPNNAIGGGYYYDKWDEMDAYNRGYSFREGQRITNINQLPSNYDKLPNERRNIWGRSAIDPGLPVTPENLQHMSTKNNEIIRYNGRTYFPQR